MLRFIRESKKALACILSFAITLGSWISLPVVQAADTSGTGTPSEQRADLLDVDFASGEPVDRANGATVTRFGAPVIADDSIIGAKSATFDGIDDAYQVPFGDAYSVINTNRVLTFECVFKVNTVKSSARVCSNIENAGIGFLLDNPATLQFAIHNGSYRFAQAPMPTSGWVYAVGVWDGSNSYLFINGEQVGGPTAVTGTITVPATNARKMTIGADSGPTNPANYSAVSVSNVRVYSRALTSAQIAQNFDEWSGSFPVASLSSSVPAVDEHLTTSKVFRATFANAASLSHIEYKLDGQTIMPGQLIGEGMSAGSHTITITGKDPVGKQMTFMIPFTSATIPQTLLLDVDFASGEPVERASGAQVTRFGAPVIADDPAIAAKTATFDGIDDAYQVPFSDAYSVINTNGALTFECVFKVNTVKSSARVCSNIENAGIGFLLDNPATLQFAIHNGSYKFAQAPMPTSGWVYAVGVWDGSNSYLFINGEQVGGPTAVTGTITTPATNAQKMTIGADSGPTNPNNFSAVSISNVRVYSRALTAAQIAQNFDEWYASFPVASLLTSVPAVGEHLTTAKAFKATFANGASITDIEYRLDGQTITSGQLISEGMSAGNHTITITGKDPIGEPMTFTIPFTSADISENATLLLDVDFASGAPVDRANGASVASFGAPVIADDPAIGAKTATFDGSDDAYQVPFGDAYSAINTNRALTFACVFKVNTVKSSARVCSNIENAGIGFLLDNPATLQFAVHNGSYRFAQAPMPTSGWVYAVGVWDGSNSYLYINGERVGGPTAVTGTITTPATNAQKMTIGADSGPTNPNNFSAVSISNVRVYSKALTAEQIAQSFDEWYASFPVASLLTSVPAAGERLTTPKAFSATFANASSITDIVYGLDGQTIMPGQLIGEGMSAGSHTITITGKDPVGEQMTFMIPFTSANIPTGGGTEMSQNQGTVTLSAVAYSPNGGDLTTTFKKADIRVASGGNAGSFTEIPSTLNFIADNVSLITGDQLEDGIVSSETVSVHDAMPYQRFNVQVPAGANEPLVRWTGIVDPGRTVSLYVWDLNAQEWTKVASSRGTSSSNTTLSGSVSESQIDNYVVHVLVVGSDPDPFTDNLSPRDASAGTPAEKDHFENPADYDFAFVHWTDPQYLAEGATGGSKNYLGASTYQSLSGVQTPAEQAVFAKAYTDTVNWVVYNKDNYKIVYAAHSGDLIQNDTGLSSYAEQALREYAFATDAYTVFDGSGIVNQVIAGNHDNANGTQQGATSLFSQAFTASDLYTQSAAWPAGASFHTMDEITNPDGTIASQGINNDNNYVLFSAGGQDFVAVGLSYGVTQEEADWANTIFQRYKDRNGILITHSYLRPSAQGDGRNASLTNDDGSMLYQQVVAANPNIFLVLSGHTDGVGINLKKDVSYTIDTTHNVVELLANYQEYTIPASNIFTPANCPTCQTINTPDANGNTGIDVDGDGIADHRPTDQMKFGASFLRLLQFNLANATMSVDTYSPFLDEFGASQYDNAQRYNGAADNFTVPVNLSTRKTSFRTDGISVLSSSDTVIGSDTVNSGSLASVTWSGLIVGQPYAWLAVSQDSAGDGKVYQFGGVFVATEAGTMSSPVMTSLKISDTVSPAQAGKVEQTVVTATYSNGSTTNVSAWAQYTSSNPNVAEILPTVLAIYKKSGTTVVSATYGGLTSNAVTIQVDGTTKSTARPGKLVLADNNGYDNGIPDGTYDITMNLWYGENGWIYKLYENDVLVDTQMLNDQTPAAQTAVTAISGKTNGVYRYRAELVNGLGATSSDTHVVTVTKAAPDKPELAHNNWDGDGSYQLNMNLWWGTNGGTYRLYENEVLIDTQTLTEHTPAAQSAVTNITNKGMGTYVYRAELVNYAGVTSSDRLTVIVSK